MKVLDVITREFNLIPMEDSYAYVKDLQKDSDGSMIKYSDEYYDILGIYRKGK